MAHSLPTVHIGDAEEETGQSRETFFDQRYYIALSMAHQELHAVTNVVPSFGALLLSVTALCLVMLGQRVVATGDATSRHGLHSTKRKGAFVRVRDKVANVKHACRTG